MAGRGGSGKAPVHVGLRQMRRTRTGLGMAAIVTQPRAARHCHRDDIGLGGQSQPGVNRKRQHRAGAFLGPVWAGKARTGVACLNLAQRKGAL